MIALGPEEIVALLPHRYPFLLVDRVLEVVRNEYAIGLKNVTLNEPFFQGHFPDYRVMPGVLVIESMAQVGGVLVYYSNDASPLDKLPLFTNIDRCRFRRQVIPGDQLRLHVEIMRRRGPIWRFRGRAYVGDSLAAEAELQAILKDRPQERPQEGP
ncbi:3-hydroxyacyl-ACP dehydratase FabZ [Candidatus Entotheonella palauensis]|uniref:3-hydroxyacyl-[acyl-carrier-protein] dehydratase FabZ n=1 Tax=Candidatus Entotheonella gemina TaxID=1429439 RepID=W4MEC4_9BACT|nr:3-hydroxyacyl-ACP dehydratase FabZ [Candidatus Entotheonella palauensis]ETX08689.1 MAG: 3-hydroxyacyl-ACP dehydratase [Candidatus Entotheonella gemina]